MTTTDELLADVLAEVRMLRQDMIALLGSTLERDLAAEGQVEDNGSTIGGLEGDELSIYELFKARNSLKHRSPRGLLHVIPTTSVNDGVISGFDVAEPEVDVDHDASLSVGERGSSTVGDEGGSGPASAAPDSAPGDGPGVA